MSTYLEEKRAASLYGDWLPKYQHVERLGHDDVQGLLDGDVYVQDKMDGANLTVAWDDEKGLVVASRNQTVSLGGYPATGFNGAVDYVLDHPNIARVCRERKWILRGEWATRHTLNYAAQTYKKFYVFDVQELGTLAYLAPHEYADVLDEAGILHIPVTANLSNPTVDALTALVHGPDAWGAPQKEGIVIKRVGFVNKWGRTTWAKLVSADFKEKNKMEFGPTRYDPPELAFAARVTQEDVLKVIYKIRDANGTTTIRDMPQVLGRVWHDVFEDHLWDFVGKEKVGAFDFKTARKLVETRARETALAFYNGLLEVTS